MTECNNPAIPEFTRENPRDESRAQSRHETRAETRAETRDRLPEFVAGRMVADEERLFVSHVAQCAACAADVALLRLAHAARPVAPSVDVSRIVAALPVPARTLTLVNGGANTITRRPPASRVWRIAATIAVAALGGYSVLTLQQAGARDGTAVIRPAGTAASADMSVRETVAVSAPAAGATAQHIGTRQDGSASGADFNSPSVGSAARGAALAVDLSEYSDEDLQRVLERLDKWDGATSTDPILPVPIIAVSSRGTE